MIRSTKFWIPMAVFQVVFGLAVFAITRQYYISDSENVSADPAAIGQPMAAWPDPIAVTALAQVTSSMPSESSIEDPFEISRQADEFFINKKYGRAADMYEKLLVLNPNNVDTYNNLGITLHYVGRSTEALSRLNEGVALDPGHQRIWLKLGFLNTQLGNIYQARTALTTAAQMETDNEVGQSALRMLESLP
jgi:Flp pilus assembly protein TadD